MHLGPPYLAIALAVAGFLSAGAGLGLLFASGGPRVTGIVLLSAGGVVLVAATAYLLWIVRERHAPGERLLVGSEVKARKAALETIRTVDTSSALRAAGTQISSAVGAVPRAVSGAFAMVPQRRKYEVIV